jgi:tetratricopeptide (TPR) repeat protein
VIDPCEPDFGVGDTAPQMDALDDGLDMAAVRHAAFTKLFGATDEPPPRVHRFSILERVGAGAMGQVFAAYDPELDRKVAIKLMHPGLGGPGSQGRARLLREAQAMARLDHENVVAIHDVGTVGDQVFIAMEFIAGGTLAGFLREKKPEPSRVLELLVQAGRGLAEAHAAGIVHRDFKPDNVMISWSSSDVPRARVSDFGLARATELEQTATSTATAPSASPSVRVTATGVVVGTPAYMAPEQFLGQDAGPAADQFAFCVVLHEALSSRRPFAGETFEELRESVVSGNLALAPLEGVGRHVRAALRRGLATRPEDRWPDLASLLRELERDPAATRRRVVSVLGLAGASAIALWAWPRDTAPPCAIERDRLGEAWSVERRAEGERAFANTEVPYAAATWSRIASAVDTWTDEWLERRRDACLATHVRGEQSEARLDLRMSCLDRELARVDAITQVLVEVDAETLDELATVPEALPELERCDLGLEVADTPPPPAIAEDVKAVQAGLARTDALKVAGRYAEGLELARRLADEAVALDHPPLVAEALLARGRMEQRTGDAASGETTLEAALVAAEAIGYDGLRLAASLELTWTVGHALGRGADGRRWGRLAGATIQRLGRTSTRAESELESNLGAIEQVQRNLKEARRHHERALSISERLEGPESLPVATDVYNLALIEKDMGDLDAAEAHLARAQSIFEATYGRDHPDTANVINVMALVAYHRGDHARASELHAVALDIFERMMGPDHPYVVTALGGLANAAERDGRLADAEAHQRRALEILARTGKADSAPAGVLHINLGNVLFAQARHDAALTSYREAERILEAAFGPEFGVLAHVYAGQGRALLGLGDREAARSMLQRAWVSASKDEAADPLLRGQVGAALAPLQWEAAEHATAVETARLAREAFARAANATGSEVERLAAWLAEHEDALGHGD